MLLNMGYLFRFMSESTCNRTYSKDLTIRQEDIFSYTRSFQLRTVFVLCWIDLPFSFTWPDGLVVKPASQSSTEWQEQIKNFIECFSKLEFSKQTLIFFPHCWWNSVDLNTQHIFSATSASIDLHQHETCTWRLSSPSARIYLPQFHDIVFSPHPRWKSVNLKNITSSFKHNQTSSWPLLRSTSSIMFDICLYSLWGIVYMYTVFSLLSDWTDSRQVSLIQHILNSASYPNKSNEVTEFESSNHGHFLLKWPLKRFD